MRQLTLQTPTPATSNKTFETQVNIWHFLEMKRHLIIFMRFKIACSVMSFYGTKDLSDKKSSQSSMWLMMLET